jgi:hypothetical protein
VQANGWGNLEAAIDDLVDLTQRFAGGRCRVALADSDRPIASV